MNAGLQPMRGFGFAAAFQFGGAINQSGRLGNTALPTQIGRLQPTGFAQNSFAAGPAAGANIAADQRLAGGSSFGNACNRAKTTSSTGQMPTMETLMKQGQQLFQGIQNLMNQFKTMFGAGAPATLAQKPACPKAAAAAAGGTGAPAGLAQQPALARPNLPAMGSLPSPQQLAGNIGQAPAQIAKAQGADKGGKVGGFLSKIGEILGKIPGMEKVSEIFNKVTGVVDAFKKGGVAGGIQSLLDNVLGLFGGGKAGKSGLGGILGGLLKGVLGGKGKGGGLGDILKGVLGGGKGKGGGLGGILKGILGGGGKGLLGGLLGGGKGGGLLKAGLGLVTKFL